MSFFKNFLAKKEESTNQDLIEAIKKDNVKRVKDILSIEDINKEDSDFNRPIDFALKFSSLNVTKYLLENGALLDDEFEGQSIISYLIQHNSTLDMLEYVYNIGASSKSEYGQSPLKMALNKATSSEIFEFVFKNFGTQLEDDEEMNIIHEIAQREDIDVKEKAKIISILVQEYDFDINDSQGVLHLASKLFNERDFELLKELIKVGLCINSIIADFSEIIGHSEFLKLFKDIIKYPVNEPKYFLDILDFETFKEYLSGFDSIDDSMQIITSITLNSKIHDADKIKLAQIAVEKGASLNELKEAEHPVNQVFTFVLNFIIRKNTIYLDYLLDNGVKIEERGFSGLFQAVIDNDIDLVKHLLKRGADVNFVNYFRNTITNCIILPRSDFKNVQERISMLQLLVDNGLDLNIKISHYKNSSTNDTPVLEAMLEICESEFIDYVIENFPDLEVTALAIQYAITREDLDIETSKKVISKDPYVLFEKSIFNETTNTNYDASILYKAVMSKKEELTNYILDNFPNVKAYSESYPLALTASYKEFSISTIKRLIDVEPNINRLYNIFPDEPSTAPMLILFLKDYIKDYSEDECLEILECMFENGADISGMLSTLDCGNQYLDSNGALAIYIVANLEIQPKIIDLILSQGLEPYKPASNNMNESQMHTIINRHRQVSDELCLELLEYFDKKGYKIDFEHRNSVSTDIFLGAAMMNRPKVLKWLANKGANVHSVGGFDNSPALHKAISNYHSNDSILRAQTVKTLIELGCDIEQIDSEQFTPLMSASFYGCFEAVKVLLEANANVNFYNEAGESAAQLAILTDNQAYDNKENSILVYSKILAVLRDAGANLDESFSELEPPLHLSIKYNKKELFDILLQLEVDINILDKNGNSPINRAIASADMYYVNKLMNKNAKIDTINNFNESIHFFAVMRANEDESEKMLKYFFEQKIPLTNGKDGFDLMQIVGYYVNIKAFHLIKNLFNDLNTKNAQGFTALLWASYSNLEVEESKRIALIKLLVEHGANINQRLPDGANALVLALYAEFKDVAEVLIELGCDVQVALNTLKDRNDISEEIISYLESKL
ncbi:ankyrin repeat domain-containing protein [Aliarcobacter butzleri]|uniref:ankyrin repeat domain-containing protein n=1 Tax=Aliarcobacter butzleri TaxID=28197 RepID=UPI002B2533D6|nr:ankyrin repeat domain-containing protein [Aliarcobacter butzleri]